MSGLASLAGASRRLREFALPLLWTCFDLQSVKDLGSLCELFKACPYLTRYVKHFDFEWTVDQDFPFSGSEAYIKKRSTLLEAAFSDRVQVWEDRRARSDGVVTFERDKGRFVHRNRIYTAPGRFKGRRDTDGKDVYFNHTGGRGPDGNGEDARIKTPEEFVNCLVELISQFTSLRNFAWTTTVPMPPQAVDALATLTTLVDLDIWMIRSRHALCNCKYFA